nr:uncharacterized protein LOC127299806 [Lolium perenne]
MEETDWVQCPWAAVCEEFRTGRNRRDDRGVGGYSVEEAAVVPCRREACSSGPGEDGDSGETSDCACDRPPCTAAAAEARDWIARSPSRYSPKSSAQYLSREACDIGCIWRDHKPDCYRLPVHYKYIQKDIIAFARETKMQSVKKQCNIKSAHHLSELALTEKIFVQTAKSDIQQQVREPERGMK